MMHSSPVNYLSKSIPSNVTIVDDGVFCSCSLLRKVNLCEGLKQIGNDAFQYCKSLQRINVPSMETITCKWSFCNCSKMSEVRRHEGLQQIGFGVFNLCTSLEHISIPSTMTKIVIRYSILAIS